MDDPETVYRVLPSLRVSNDSLLTAEKKYDGEKNEIFHVVRVKFFLSYLSGKKDCIIE